APGLRMQLVETGADLGLAQGRQLRVVLHGADVVGDDAQFLPASLVVRHLAPAIRDQGLQLLPLQGGDALAIQPLAGLVFALVVERPAPAQSALVERKQDPPERGLVEAAHGSSRAMLRPDQASSRPRTRGRPPARRRCRSLRCSMSSLLQQRSNSVIRAYTGTVTTPATSRVGNAGQ